MKLRSKIVAAVFVVAGLATIAYAAFSQSLAINGTANTTANWNVAITGITKTGSTGATDVSAPTFTGTSANFNVNLAYPGASATYDVTVTNTGNIKAELASLAGLTEANSATPSDITYAVTGVTPTNGGTAGTTLASNGGTNTVTVTVTWDPSSTATAAETKSLPLTLNYVQSANQ